MNQREQERADAFRRAMTLRRWFLILAAPLVLFLTLYAFAQWQRLWNWFAN